MPLVKLPIRDIHPTVERPVFLGVVRDLLDVLELSTDTPVNYYGIDSKNSQANTSLSSWGLKENRWNFDERIFIEVEEEADPAFRWVTVADNRKEVMPTFADPDLDIYIRPVYSVQKVKINFKYRAADKNRALMWRNAMRTKLSLNHDVYLHEVSFSYGIPAEFLIIAHHLHSLRETQGEYGQEWGEYFTDHLTNNCSVQTNASGSSTTWAVSERQNRVQGYIEAEVEPEKGSRENDQDNWQVGFTYTFQYTKPIAFQMSYPIVIHNQLIDQKFRPSESIYRLEDQKTYFSLSGMAFESFTSDQRALMSSKATGVNLPLFDEWRIPVCGNGFLPIFSALCSVDLENPRALLNLETDLEEYKLHQVIVDFLKAGEYQYTNLLYGSIIQINLFENASMIKQDQITIDSSLNVGTAFDMDVRKTYRLVVSLMCDFSYLTPKTIERLQKYPSQCTMLADHMNSILLTLGQRADLRKLRLSDVEYELITSKKYHPTFGRNSRINFGQMTLVPQYGGSLS